MAKNVTVSAKKRKAQRKLHERKELLKLYREAEKEILTGGDQSYSIGGKQISRRTYSLDSVREEIKLLEDEIDALEDILEGLTPVRSRRMIPRDW